MTLEHWLILIGLVAVSGCSTVIDRLPTNITSGDRDTENSSSITERAEAASGAKRVSNPPARQIRFDGQERLLGGGTCEALPTGELLRQVADLLEKGKLRSAQVFVQLHERSARRLLLDQIGSADRHVLQFVASTLDDGAETPLWGNLLAEFQQQPQLSAEWQSFASKLLTSAEDAESVNSAIDELTTLSGRFHTPLIRIEALRLKGELLVASDRAPTAIETLVTAAELATQVGSPSHASDFWLMACEASLRIDAVEQARKCWTAAVSTHLTSLHARSQRLPTIDTVFWEQAVRLTHPEDSLPKELTLTLAPWYSRIGIRIDQTLPPTVALWAAIADYQLATGQPHIASLSIKRAETHASTQMRPFLQIALARAMAAQGQQSIATTILGTEAKSQDPNIRASALAVLGAIKVQSGAYEQGSQFLSQALSVTNATQWPGKLNAKADLANVRLILGHLEDALPALHQVQNEMMTANKWQSLCHCLENEAAILKLDGRHAEARQIMDRIDQIERSFH